MESVMIVRHLIGDVALAVLIAVPVTVLARPQAVRHDQASASSFTQQKSTVALATAADRQIGLFR
jgi:hypothetical protein